MEYFRIICMIMLFIRLGNSAGSKIVCLQSGICARKCCPEAHIFDAALNQCKPENEEAPNESSTLSTYKNPSSFCLEGKWLDDIRDKDNSSILNVNCIEDVFEGREIQRKGRVCTNLEAKYAVQSSKLPLNKCCMGSENVYDIGNRNCHSNANANLSHWPPPVHSVVSGNVMNLSAEDFHLRHELTTCPDGYIIQNSDSFTLYEDGSIRIHKTKSNINAREFCIDSFVNEKSEVQLAAHYCLPDPCLDNICVRKCCPKGFVMNMGTQSCEFSSHSFAVQFQNESGYPIDVPPNSFIVRYGIKPICTTDMQLLDPVNYKDDEFFLLSNGNIYVPQYPESSRHIDVYCIEDFLNDGQIERKSLICFGKSPELPPDQKVVLSFFPYMMFISSIFLIATFIVYAIIPEIRNIHGVTIMCHVASLATTYICLGTIQLDTMLPIPACIGLAIVAHFTFLASFTWLNVMSFDIWLTFSFISDNIESASYWLELLSTSSNYPKPLPTAEFASSSKMIDDCDTTLKNEQEASDEDSGCGDGELRPSSPRHGRHRIGRRFVFYSLYAWGVPLIIVIVGQILDNLPGLEDEYPNILRPQFGAFKCWFSDRMAILAYFYGPVAAILLSNLVFFILTAIRLHRARRDTAFATKNHQNKQNYVVIFSLFVLMGVTWITEVITANIEASAYYSIPTDILNILTGIFIFVIFVCKRKVRRLLRKKFQPVERVLRRGKQFTITQDTTTSSATSKSQRLTSDSSRKATSSTNVTQLTRDTSLEAVNVAK